jgi:hypothetical protein
MELTEQNILHAGRDTRAALRAAAIGSISPRGRYEIVVEPHRAYKA